MSVISVMVFLMIKHKQSKHEDVKYDCYHIRDPNMKVLSTRISAHYAGFILAPSEGFVALGHCLVALQATLMINIYCL